MSQLDNVNPAAVRETNSTFPEVQGVKPEDVVEPLDVEAIPEDHPVVQTRPFPEETPVERPGGITFLAWLNIIAGSFMGLFTLSALGEASSEEVGVVLFLLMLAAFSIVVGIGLLRLRPWARVVAIIGYSFNAFMALVSLPESFVQLLVAGGILMYLFSERVQHAFSGNRTVSMSPGTEYQNSEG